MKRILKRSLAMLLCLIMVFPMCTTAFAADSRTEQYAKKAAAAGIKKVTGEIPVVGGAVSDIIDAFLPNLLGIKSNHDEVMAKLDEIQNAINNLGQQMDANQQALFQQFYKEKIDAFNQSLTKEKNRFAYLSTRVYEIEQKYGSEQRDEKQVALATLITNSDVSVLSSDLITLTDYICGTQVSNRQEEGILTLAYKLNCKDSVLGCEAALKTSDYADVISGYIESAYTTLFTIAMAKLYVCENYNRLMALDNDDINRSDLSGYTSLVKDNINSAVFTDNRTSLRAHYNRLFDEDNQKSVICTYNNMIKDSWFSYIDGTNYQNDIAEVTYIPLNPEIGFVSPYAFGYNESLEFSSRKSPPVDYSKVDKRLMQTAHEVLTVDQIKRLMEHLANNSIFGTDAENLSYLQVLTDIGFSFDAYSAYVDKLQEDSGIIGTMYRDPSKPKWETDGMTKIFPMSTDAKLGTMKVFPAGSGYDGWMGDYVIGYNLSDSVNNNDNSASAMIANMCYMENMKNDKPGTFDYDPNIMLLYFTEPIDATPVGAFFGRLSPATIPIICIGAAAIIAIPTAILIRRKKEKNLMKGF